MSNNLTTLRTYIWAALDADSTLGTMLAGGTRVRWASGTLIHRTIRPAMCPVLTMGPEDVQVPSLANAGHDSREEWRYALRFGVHAAGQDVSVVEDIVHQVIAVLAGQFPFSMADLYAMDLREVRFDPPDSSQAGEPIWHASFLADARYRIA